MQEKNEKPWHKKPTSSILQNPMRFRSTPLRQTGFTLARFRPRAGTGAALCAVLVALLVAGAAVAEGYHSNP